MSKRYREAHSTCDPAAGCPDTRDMAPAQRIYVTFAWSDMPEEIGGSRYYPSGAYEDKEVAERIARESEAEQRNFSRHPAKPIREYVLADAQPTQVEQERRSIMTPEQALRQGDVLSEVQAERCRQDMQWGGPAHDDEHALADWLGYIRDQTLKAYDELRGAVLPRPESGAPGRCMEDTRAATRARLVKIAALAVAAIESIDRKVSR